MFKYHDVDAAVDRNTAGRIEFPKIFNVVMVAVELPEKYTVAAAVKFAELTVS